jgi:hypothetical protein
MSTLKKSSKNLIPSRTLVAMTTERKNLKYLLLVNRKELEFKYLA